MPRFDKHKCLICKKLFTTTNINNHVSTCVNSLAINKKNLSYLLKVSDEFNLGYFMYVLVPTNSKLLVLDDFLKKMWLECCGHLSKFTINGIEYNDFDYGCVDEDEKCEKKDTKLSKIKDFNVGMIFTHEYDFGTTTTLQIKVLDKLNTKNLGLKLLVRNSNPKYKCEGCKKYNSTKTCVMTGEMFCEECVPEEETSEEPIFNIINSPRQVDCYYMSN